MPSATTHYRAYALTINNPLVEHEATLCNSLSYDYLIYQYEMSTSGTPHIQAYCFFSKRVAFSALKALLPSAHIESAKGSPQQNIHYCSKPVPSCACKHCRDPLPIRLDGPYEYGARPVQGKRNDLVEATLMIDAGHSVLGIVKANRKMLRVKRYLDSYIRLCIPPRDRNIPPNVYIRWGEPGVGKTRWCYDNYSTVYKCPAPSSSGTVWFDGYVGQSCILLDDWPLVDCKDDLYNFLLDLCDRYPTLKPVKGDFVSVGSSSIVLTSNADPDTWFGGKGLRALARRVTTVLHVSALPLSVSDDTLPRIPISILRRQIDYVPPVPSPVAHTSTSVHPFIRQVVSRGCLMKNCMGVPVSGTQTCFLHRPGSSLASFGPDVHPEFPILSDNHRPLRSRCLSPGCLSIVSPGLRLCRVHGLLDPPRTASRTYCPMSCTYNTPCNSHQFCQFRK